MRAIVHQYRDRQPPYLVHVQVRRFGVPDQRGGPMLCGQPKDGSIRKLGHFKDTHRDPWFSDYACPGCSDAFDELS